MATTFDFATVPQTTAAPQAEMPDTPAFIEALNQNLFGTPTWSKSAAPFLSAFVWTAPADATAAPAPADAYTIPGYDEIAHTLRPESAADMDATSDSNHATFDDDKNDDEDDNDDDDDDDDTDLASSLGSDDGLTAKLARMAPATTAAPARQRTSARMQTRQAAGPAAQTAATATAAPVLAPGLMSTLFASMSAGAEPPVGRKGAPRGPRRHAANQPLTEDDKRREFDARLEKNRISARECRLRKKAKIMGLLQRIAVLEADNAALAARLKAAGL
jgi:hypothetical protein